jgi:hypothetical protein
MGYPKVESKSLIIGDTKWDLPGKGYTSSKPFVEGKASPLPEDMYTPELQKIKRHFISERGRNILYTEELGDFTPGSYLYAEKIKTVKSRPTYLRSSKAVNVLDMLLVRPQGQLYQITKPKINFRMPSLNFGYSPKAPKPKMVEDILANNKIRHSIFSGAKPDTKVKPTLKESNAPKSRYFSNELYGIGLGLSMFESQASKESTKEQTKIMERLGEQTKSITREITIPRMRVPNIPALTRTTTTPKEPKKTTSTPNTPGRTVPPRTPGKPGIPKIPRITFPSFELPDMSFGLSEKKKKKKIVFRTIKTPMLTLKGLLGQK